MEQAENGGWLLTGEELAELGQLPSAEVAAREHVPLADEPVSSTAHRTPPALTAAMLAKTTYPVYAQPDAYTMQSGDFVWAGQ
jgi:hypothetical protein